VVRELGTDWLPARVFVRKLFYLVVFLSSIYTLDGFTVILVSYNKASTVPAPKLLYASLILSSTHLAVTVVVCFPLCRVRLLALKYL